MKNFLFLFAVMGWTLGLIVHLLSLVDYDVAEKIPFVWALHIGVFIVWVPVVISLKNNQALQEFQRSGMLNRMNPLGFFKIIFKDTPVWLTVIAVGGFFYAFINFALFFISQPGSPSVVDGQYILQDHGHLIKILTVQEYHHYKANEVRGFSGHWMAFYGMAAAVLFPYTRKPEITK